MFLAPILLALAATLVAVEPDIVFPLNAKLENGDPDPRAGMHIKPASYYTSKMYGHSGDKFIEKTDAEIYAFGKSYHSNRSIDWNETNLGAGLGLAYHYDSKTDVTFVAGSYQDSYNERAQFALLGARFVAGDRDGAHATFGMSGGYFKGSDFHGVGIMPVVSVGYDWLDLCVTGCPPGIGGANNNKNTGSRDPQENHGAASGFIGLFLKIRLVTF